MITVTGWQRPQLFRTLLESLAMNDLQGWVMQVQLEPSGLVDQYRAAASELLGATPVHIAVNPKQLGIRLNPYDLLNRVFQAGADLVLYLEEDLQLAPDATALAQWYAENHRREWMCLSLLSGGCGSEGFISDRRYPDILFAGRTFNSLGFAVNRNEWDCYLRPAWLADGPIYDCRVQRVDGWDWSVYLQLIRTRGLYTVQPVTARATHTGRHGGVYCTPEFHDAAFAGLELAEGRSHPYRLVARQSLPPSLRRQASLWEQVNCAVGVINALLPAVRLRQQPADA